MTFQDLVQIMKKLRSPKGCPWDKKQTHHSIRESLVEETYELIDAIDDNDMDHIKEELGDLLLHVVFHAEIERGKKTFSIDDVTDTICRKLIRRHPHVFMKRKVKSVDDVIRNWDEIKSQEKAGKERRNHLDRIPRSLPPMSKTKKILDIAYKEGFRWKHPSDLEKKIHEEVEEFLTDIRKKKKPLELEDEFGDIMFVLVNIAREKGVDPESALNKANRKFTRRFNHVEDELRKKGKKIRDSDFDTLLSLWKKAKKKHVR